MLTMKLSQAAKILEADFTGKDVYFEGVCIDTRETLAGKLFISIVGRQYDGHDFLLQALEKGAVGAVVAKSFSSQVPLPLIKVQNTREALAKLACSHRQQLSPVVIGVTGSCGKTTTKSLLKSVFSQQGKTLASQQSFNNEIGVPLTLLQIEPDHEFVICELGANHPGEIAHLTHLARPDVAIVTNAGKAHLEGFGSLQGVACAKAEIFQGLSSGGVAIINADHQYASFWKKQASSHSIITFSCEDRGDVRAESIELNEKGQPKFKLILPNRASCQVQLQLFGTHNVMNALSASAAAYAQNIPLASICAGLISTKPVAGRLLEQRGLNGAAIIDDTYNANPLSISAALLVLARRSENSFFVLGDMLELGEHSESLHQQIGWQAKRLGIRYLYCYGLHSQHAAIAFGENAFYFQDQKELVNRLCDHVNENATVLIKGSRAMGMKKIVTALVNHENDGD